MDRAPLRPVPGRPGGPVSDADAVRHAASVLPAAAERDRVALGLVVLAGHPRGEVASRLGLTDDGLALVLAGARKELRRTVVALPGSGWCERAERLISDRLDGALAAPSQARLDVHLRNCPRCVEHERRLVQAIDALVASVVPAPGPPELAPVPAEEPTAPKTTSPKAATGPAAGPSASAPRSAAASAPQGPRRVRQVAIALSWQALLAIAIVLALASLALAVAGLLGAEL
jgi:hypothetical protein